MASEPVILDCEDQVTKLIEENERLSSELADRDVSIQALKIMHKVEHERANLLEPVVLNLASFWHAENCGETANGKKQRPRMSWRVCQAAHCIKAQQAIGITLADPTPRTGVGDE